MENEADPAIVGFVLRPARPHFVLIAAKLAKKASTKHGATALNAALGDLVDRPEWLTRIAEIKAEGEVAKAVEIASDSAPIQPPRVMADLAARRGDDDIVVSDALFRRAGSRVNIPAKRSGRQFLFARGQGGAFGSGRDWRG